MYRIALSILIITFTTLITSAQSRYRTSFQDYYLSQSIGGNRFLKRLSISGGVHLVTGKAAIKFDGFLDNLPVKKEYSTTIKNKDAYAGAIGVYFPIKIISDNTMLVWNIELMATYSKLQFDSLPIQNNRRIQLSVETYRAGIPVSLEYRTGSDILLNKNVKSMFTIGGGIMPGYIHSDDYDRQSPIIFTPFIKAELGFFAIIGVKVRATYFIGHINYSYSEDYDLLNSKNMVTTEFKGSPGITLSLVILPFSYLWNK